MKKLISKGLLAVIFTVGLVANASAVQKRPVTAERFPKHGITAKSFCIEGYMFIVLISGEGSVTERGVAITQIYEQGGGVNRPPQPKKCGN